MPPSSISVPGTLHSVQDRPEDESASLLYQHRSDTTEQKETTSIVSKGTSTLIHQVDELLDDASSVIRCFDTHIAVVHNSGDQEKNIVHKACDGKNHPSTMAAGRRTRSSSRAKQSNRP